MLLNLKFRHMKKAVLALLAILTVGAYAGTEFVIPGTGSGTYYGSDGSFGSWSPSGGTYYGGDGTFSSWGPSGGTYYGGDGSFGSWSRSGGSYYGSDGTYGHWGR